MAISYADTRTIEDIGIELNSLASELNDKINSLYNRLGNVPYGTGEWVGNSAIYYFNTIQKDKQQYITLVSNIREISSTLQRHALQINETIKDNLNKEGK